MTGGNEGLSAWRQYYIYIIVRSAHSHMQNKDYRICQLRMPDWLNYQMKPNTNADLRAIHIANLFLNPTNSTYSSYQQVLWLDGYWSVMPQQHVRSYQCRYWLVTVDTHGDFIMLSHWGTRSLVPWPLYPYFRFRFQYFLFSAHPRHFCSLFIAGIYIQLHRPLYPASVHCASVEFHDAATHHSPLHVDS